MPKMTQHPHQSIGIGSGGDDCELRTSSTEAAEYAARMDLVRTNGIKNSPPMRSKTFAYSSFFYHPVKKDR
jgi:hypothetical protein